MNCSADNCSNRAVYKRPPLCRTHYKRQQRHGDPNIRLKVGRKPKLQDGGTP